MPALKYPDVGADVLDQTGQDVLGFGQLQEEPVFWELSEDQQNYQRFVQEINDYFSKEYHAIQEILWRGNGIPTFSSSIPQRYFK